MMARGKKKESTLTPEERLAQALVPVEEQPYPVPENWCWTTLGSINQFDGGNVDPLKNPEKTFELYSVPSSAENYPEIIQGADIGSTKQSVDKNDVLLCKINPRINRVWYVHGHTDNELLASSEWIVIRNAHVNCRYLMWCLRSKYFREYMLSNVSGVGGSLMRAQPKYVQEYPIPLAPLAEQHRIVARIESLFAKLDEAKEKAQAVLDSFETRKAAILHKAFSGELTERWREEQGISFASWTNQVYADLGNAKLGKMLDKAKNTGVHTPYLRNVNVRWFSFDLSDVAEMLATESEIETLAVKTGDLFICEGGEPGRCAIWTHPDTRMIFQKALHRFRPNEKVISEYLCYHLHYLALKGDLEEHFTGSTIKHLTGQALAKIPILLPGIEEQTTIVQSLESIFKKEQQAKDAATSVIDQIDAMKKSILAKAFRGELGTNDPSEENAAELLKAIL